MGTPKIITYWTRNPTPMTQYDWSAYRECYEPGEHIGHGETKEAAIADLIENEGER